MWRNLWQQHTGKCAGTAAGLFFGIVYLIVGFWDMLFLALLVFVGFQVGKRIDRGEPGPNFSRILDWLNNRWRMFR